MSKTNLLCPHKQHQSLLMKQAHWHSMFSQTRWWQGWDKQSGTLFVYVLFLSVESFLSHLDRWKRCLLFLYDMPLSVHSKERSSANSIRLSAPIHGRLMPFLCFTFIHVFHHAAGLEVWTAEIKFKSEKDPNIKISLFLHHVIFLFLHFSHPCFPCHFSRLCSWRQRFLPSSGFNGWLNWAYVSKVPS